MTPEEFGQSYYEWYMQEHVTSLSGPLFFASVGVLKVWNEIHARTAVEPNTFAEVYRRAQFDPAAKELYLLLLTHKLKS